MTQQRTVVDVVRSAVQDFCAREMTGEPEHDAKIAQWYAEEWVTWVVMLDPRFGEDARGRRDTRAMRYRFGLCDPKGLTPTVFLCEVLAKDALDMAGHPVDWRGDARTFLLQLGIGVPDNVSALLPNDSAPPVSPKLDDTGGA